MRKFLFTARQLMNIQRCATTRKTKSMSVAEHSYYVAMIAMLIADEDPGLDINRKSVLEKALLHDLEESMSGDIIYPVKHFSPEANAAINAAVKGFSDKMYAEQFPEYRKYQCIQETAKQGLEGQIVALADAVELMVYCGEEVLAGNQFMYAMFKTAIDIVKKCDYYPKSEAVMQLTLELESLIVC